MPLSGLETAIRSALERSDRENAEQRARIYQSARQALEAGMHKKQIADRDVIEVQRRQLEEIIHKIELEERQRLAATHDVTTARTEPSLTATRLRPSATNASQQPGNAPSDSGNLDDLHAVRADATPRATSPMADHTEGLDFGAEAVAKTRKRRSGLFSRLFILAVLVAAVGIGAWWIYTSGVLLPPSSRDTSLPSPQPTASAEDYDPATTIKGADPFEEHKTFNGDWLTVFTPERITALKPRPNATVDIVGNGENQAARLLATSGDDDGRVAITVPVDVLARMAGKTSTIAVTMKSSSDAPSRIAISCDFGQMGECPRHRFTINSERLDILFKVSFDNTSSPTTPGLLLLNPDLAGKGNGVDIFGIRVLPSN